MHTKSRWCNYYNWTVGLVGRNVLCKCWTALATAVASFTESLLVMSQPFICVVYTVTSAEFGVQRTHIQLLSTNGISPDWIYGAPFLVMMWLDPSSLKSRQGWVHITWICLSYLQSCTLHTFKHFLSTRCPFSTLEPDGGRVSACNISKWMDWTGWASVLASLLPRYNTTGFFRLVLGRGPGIQYECW
jgi:hypothetical protein